MSMRDEVSRALVAATDPGSAPDESTEIRDLLARAGLLAEYDPVRRRPDVELVRRARAAAGRGTPLGEILDWQRS